VYDTVLAKMLTENTIINVTILNSVTSSFFILQNPPFIFVLQQYLSIIAHRVGKNPPVIYGNENANLFPS
jgi:hypothetical protein